MLTADELTATTRSRLWGVLFVAVLVCGLGIAAGGAVADGDVGPDPIETVGDETEDADNESDDDEHGLEITLESEGETIVYSFEEDTELGGTPAVEPADDVDYAAPEPLPDGQALPEEVDPEDTRERVHDPWDAEEHQQAIVQMIMYFPDGDDEVAAVCSGAIVDDYHVLTAGHCVYDGDGQLGDPGFADRVEVRPAADNVDDEWIEHFGTVEARMVRTYEGYVDGGAEQHDFALLTLDRSIGEPEATATLDWQAYDEDDPIYDSMTLINHGYPGTPPQDAPYPSMWGDTGSATVPSTSFGTIPDTIEGDLHGAGGHSGSPFYHETDDGDHEIVGVLAYGPLFDTTPMFGPRVTHTKSDDLYDWIAEDGDEVYVDEPEDRPEYVFENFTFVAEDGDWYEFDAPDEVALGSTEITVEHRIRNVGTATADEVELVVRDASTDEALGSQTVASPAPFEAENVSISTTISGDVEPGEIDVYVTVESDADEFDEYDDSDETGVETITVVDPVEFDTAIDDATVADGAVTVDYTVENVGDEVGTQDVFFEVEGEEIDRFEDLELDIGEEHSGAFTYDLRPGDDGEIAVTVGTTAGTDEHTVENIAPAAFDVDVETDAAVLEGEDVEVEFAIENTGDVPAERTIAVDAGPLGSAETTDTFAAGETTETVAVATADGDVGSYLVETTAGDRADSHRVEVRERAAVPDHELGDVNGDGEVDLTDAIQVQRYLVGLTDDDEIDPALADLTRDGDVSLTDAIRLQQLIVETAAPADLQILHVDADSVEDDRTEVTARIANEGDVGAIQEIHLEADGERVASTVVDVAPGEFKTVTFTAELDADDEIEVDTGDATHETTPAEAAASSAEHVTTPAPVSLAA